MSLHRSGADPGFQVRGWALKKNCAERREARKFLGYFVRKITILRQKIIFFPILGGGGCAPGAPPPLDPPLLITIKNSIVVNAIVTWMYLLEKCSHIPDESYSHFYTRKNLTEIMYTGMFLEHFSIPSLT